MTPAWPPVLIALIATFAVQLLASAGSATTQVAAPALADAIAAEVRLLGVYTALLFVATLASGLVAGSLVTRFGAIRISQVALLSCAMGLVVATAGNTAALAVCAILVGCGLGPATPASSHLLARLAPPGWRNIVFSLKQTGVPLGIGLAGLIVPPLTVGWGWRAGFLAVAGLCLATAALLQPIRTTFDSDLETGARIRPFNPLAPLSAVLTDRKFHPLLSASLVFTGNQSCINSFLVSALVADVGMDLVSAGVVFSLALATGAAARLWWGWVADRWVRPYRVLAIVGFGIGLSNLLFGLLDASWPIHGIAAIAMVMAVMSIGWNGVYLAELSRLAGPIGAAEATGAGAVVSFTGVVIMAPLFSLILGWSGSYGLAFALFGFCSAAVALPLLRR